MKTAIEEIVRSRNPKTTEEAKAILREVVQSIVLIGLSRSGFFSKASFYGGTALRIFLLLGNCKSLVLDYQASNP